MLILPTGQVSLQTNGVRVAAVGDGTLAMAQLLASVIVLEEGEDYEEEEDQ